VFRAEGLLLAAAAPSPAVDVSSSAAPAGKAVPSAAPPAPPAPVAEVATRRPEPGLARGVWEAPRWSFFVAMAAIVVLAGLYAARRAGLFRLLRRRPRP
jgi:hypothetical protein